MTQLFIKFFPEGDEVSVGEIFRFRVFGARRWREWFFRKLAKGVYELVK